MRSQKSETIVVHAGQELSEAEIKSALRSIPRRSWDALIQIADAYRQDHAESAAQRTKDNNPFDVARELGWYECLSILIKEFSDLRNVEE